MQGAVALTVPPQGIGGRTLAKRLFNLLLAVVLCLSVLLEMAPVAAQQPDDLDCEDFNTQEEAQAVFDEDPADPNNLDPNGDGIACALLPSAADAAPAEEGGAGAEEGEVAAEQEAGDDEQAQRREERRANRQNRQNQGAEETEEPAEVSCDQFATAEEAQAAFDADPEGLAALDEDGDGVVCTELLEAAPEEEPRAERRRNRGNQDAQEETADQREQPRNQPVQEDLDCIDFDFQEEAQAIFDQDPSDPFNLDPNGDGFACSSLPLSAPLVTQVPRTGIASTEPTAWWLLASALAAGASAAGSRLLRRQG